jgi:predicted membrane GTPase involved in stress response
MPSSTKGSIDEPTLDMLFRINDSPFAGQEGSYVTLSALLVRNAVQASFSAKE